MQLRIALVALVVGAGICHADDAWTKYVSPDGAYSFHYPTGWNVQAQGQIVAIDSGDTKEQLLLILAGAEQGQTVKDIAQKFVDGLQGAAPGLKVTKWTDVDKAGKAVYADIAYDQDSEKFLGDMVVLVSGKLAMCFEYSAPAGDFSQLRAKALLLGFAKSFAAKDASTPPDTVIPDLVTGRLDRDARAFVFAIEFGLGTAFSVAEEKTVVDETILEWQGLSPDAQAKFDAYPALMQKILGLSQANLAKVQAAIHDSVVQALEQQGDSPATKILREQLTKANKVVVKGDPPLTASEADAYSELAAFARLFADNPKAGPEDIKAEDVKGFRAQLVKAWPKATVPDKQTVASAPAVWMSMRMTFAQGTAEEKEAVRRQISHMIAYQVSLTSSSGSGSGGTSGSGKPMDWATFNCLQAMKQTTFNTYMWSQHYEGWTPAGKMW